MFRRIFNINILLAGFYFLLADYPAVGQTIVKPSIIVEQMEYAYDPKISGSVETNEKWVNRVILPTDSSVAEKMKQSFLKAIDGRWNAAVKQAQWNLKRVKNPWKESPIFKPKLKTGQAGSWHLFFQVYDNGPYPIASRNSLFIGLPPVFDSLDNAPYNLQLKAALIDGTNETTVFSHKMMVELQRTQLPEGQLLLRKVPGLTTSFLQAFDSLVQVFFGTTPVDFIKLPLEPAFVFMNADTALAKATPLNFNVTGNSRIEETNLQLQWDVEKITTEKLGKKGSFGKNLVGGTFTMVTGLSSDKIKTWSYIASIGFVDKKDDQQYTCKVPYLEEEWKERNRELNRHLDGSKSYTNYADGQATTHRTSDTDHKAYFLKGTDTVGDFKIRFGMAHQYIDKFTQCWNGKDTATICNMPEFWNNVSAAAGMGMSPVYLEGSLYGMPFIIQHTKSCNQLDLMIEGQLIATLSMNYDRPSRGFLFVHPSDPRLLKAMLMLSSMPFGFFN